MTDEAQLPDSPTVFVVDGDPAARQRVARIANSMRLGCEGFETGSEFLQTYDPSSSGCLVTEVRTPEIGGIELQRALFLKQSPLPVVFLSEHTHVPVVVQAMQMGAVNFLEKPANEQHLWESIQAAVQEDKRRRQVIASLEARGELISSLEPLDRRVLELLGRGLAVREIAEDLAVSPRTVEIRRNRLMEKLGAENYVELLRFAFEVLDAAMHEANGTRHLWEQILRSPFQRRPLGHFIGQ